MLKAIARPVRILLNQSLLNKNSIVSNIKRSYSAIDLANYRSLISVKGIDSSVYLQNLITNNIYNLNETDKTCLYAMILNNRGRIMYDVLIYLLKSNDSQSNEYLVEVDSRFVGDLLKLFKMFKVKKKVEINQIESEYKLYSLFNQDNEKELLLNKENKNDLLILTQDPRYSGLGYRAIFKNTSENKIKNYAKNVNEEKEIKNYKKFMYQNGIAENNDDIKQGNSIPLEYNLVFLNGVSFDKGCYLGQELVAKTHHTGVIRKRIMPIKILNREANSSFGQDNIILNTKTGMTAGKLKNLIDDDGIAMLRLANIDKENMVLVDKNQNRFKIKITVPTYWPINDLSLSELKNFS